MAKIGCYAVARGRRPGIYVDWKDCEAQVLNFNGAKYRKFLRVADAELWLHQNTGPMHVRTETTAAAVLTSSVIASFSSRTAQFSGSPAAGPVLHVYTMSRPAAVDRSPEIASRSAHSATIPMPTLVPQQPAESAMSNEVSTTMIVYTDGSCKGNGQAGSAAGVGVWWGPEDPRNISERCPGVQTNNRAELIAIIRVLETAPTHCPLLIKSDSEYSIKCMTEWFPKWRARGWRKADGKPVQNLSLIQYLDVLLLRRREVLKQSVEFNWVLAHAGEEGNEGADILAKNGGTQPPVPEKDWNDLARRVRAAGIDCGSSVPSTAEKSIPIPSTTSGARDTKSERVPVQTTAPSSYQSRIASTELSNPSTPAVATPPQTGRYTGKVPVARKVSAQRSRTLAASSAKVHGRPDIFISQRELERYASCLLEYDELLREAKDEGVY